MADDDFGEEYGDYYYDDDYLYVEDEYAIADELAEGQVPSPGYTGTNADIAAEHYEWDNYEFWSDLAYGSDSYFDPETKLHRKRKDVAGKAEQDTHKRKRASLLTSTTTTTSLTKDKRRRVTIEQTTKSDHHPYLDNVVFRADQPPIEAPPTPESMESFALLPDWRQRFPADAEIEWAAPMPEAMKKAAEGDGEELSSLANEDKADEASPAVHNDTPVRSRKHKAKRNAQAAIEDEEDQATLPTSLDPETLRLILRQKLGNTGMDEEAFMTVMQDMLTGGAADQAAEQLTKVLLQGTEGADTSAALSWLGQQGVSVSAGAEDAEEAGNGNDRRVDSGAGLPDDAARYQPEPASQRKRKTKADPSSSVETSPIKGSDAASTAGATRSARKKTRS